MNFIDGLVQGLQPGLQAWAERGPQERVAKALYNKNVVGPMSDPGLDPLRQLAAFRASQGGAPAPQPQPQPSPAPQAGPPAAGRPAPVSIDAKPIAPAPPPGAPTGEPGAEAPTGMAATISDPVKEGQSIIQNLWQSTAAANPKADPLTLMKAVGQQLDDIKGVGPITKSVMQGQIQMMKTQMDMNFKFTKLQDENGRFAMKMQDLIQRHASQNEFDAAREEHMRNTDRINQQRADTYDEATEFQHEDREAATAQRERASERSAGTRLTLASMNNNAKSALQWAKLSNDNKTKALAEITKRINAQESATSTPLSEADKAQIQRDVVSEYASMTGRPVSKAGGGGSPAPSRSAGPVNTKDGKPHKGPDGKTYVWQNGKYHIVS